MNVELPQRAETSVGSKTKNILLFLFYPFYSENKTQNNSYSVESVNVFSEGTYLRYYKRLKHTLSKVRMRFVPCKFCYLFISRFSQLL